MQVNFRRALASFLFRLGETAEMSAVLHRLPEKWPQDVWCYVTNHDNRSGQLLVSWPLLCGTEQS